MTAKILTLIVGTKKMESLLVTTFIIQLYARINIFSCDYDFKRHNNKETVASYPILYKRGIQKRDDWITKDRRIVQALDTTCMLVQ